MTSIYTSHSLRALVAILVQNPTLSGGARPARQPLLRHGGGGAEPDWGYLAQFGVQASSSNGTQAVAAAAAAAAATATAMPRVASLHNRMLGGGWRAAGAVAARVGRGGRAITSTCPRPAASRRRGCTWSRALPPTGPGTERSARASWASMARTLTRTSTATTSARRTPTCSAARAAPTRRCSTTRR